MNQEDDFAKLNIAVVGLGLMGGSLAMALRGHCARLLGVDRDPKVLDRALERKIVDEAHIDPESIVPQADLIIFAVPVSGILHMLQMLPQIHPGPAVVLDLGSTKAQIMDRMAHLPPEFEPIGGHPMCGKETSGLEHADPSMYLGAPFALTALKRTSPGARSLAEALVGAVGAYPIWLDPESHDAWVAYTSHLPYLTAVALVSATAPEVAAMVGPGFLSATRLAGSDPEMMADILDTNREKILGALKRFRLELDGFEQALQEGDQINLVALLETARQQRGMLLEGRRTGEA